MTPSQYNAWLRQQQQRHNDAVRRYNQEVDRVNRANKAAAEKYVRDVNREIDRVNRHNQQVVNEHNRLVRQRNQNAQAAVNKYNQAVRQHNAKVASNRQQLRQLISRLESRPTTQYVEVRSSALELNQQLERVERQAHTSVGATNLFSLLEREAENSAEVANSFVSEAPEPPEGAQDTGILEYRKISAIDGRVHSFLSTHPTRTRAGISAQVFARFSTKSLVDLRMTMTSVRPTRTAN
jgi:hypothetical protein